MFSKHIWVHLFGRELKNTEIVLEMLNTHPVQDTTVSTLNKITRALQIILCLDVGFFGPLVNIDL